MARAPTSLRQAEASVAKADIRALEDTQEATAVGARAVDIPVGGCREAGFREVAAFLAAADIPELRLPLAFQEAARALEANSRWQQAMAS